MLSGGTFNASAMAGTAVFRIVVSRDSMKNPMATSHGSSRLAVPVSAVSLRGCKAGSRAQAPASDASTIRCASAVSRPRCASSRKLSA